MRIIYHCFGQAHSSVTAAHIHLGHLPCDRRPTLREIIRQPGFDQAADSEIGRPRLMGIDAAGHEVYVIGLGGGKRALEQAVSAFLTQSGVDPQRFLFANALQHAGLPLRIGGFTSRRLGLIWPGRPLAALGIWHKYPRFLALVEAVREQVGPLRP